MLLTSVVRKFHVTPREPYIMYPFADVNALFLCGRAGALGRVSCSPNANPGTADRGLSRPVLFFSLTPLLVLDRLPGSHGLRCQAGSGNSVIPRHHTSDHGFVRESAVRGFFPKCWNSSSACFTFNSV